MGTMPPPLPQGLAAPRALYVDRCAVEGLQGSCGSSLYAVQPSSFVDTELWNVPELDRSTLIFVRKIGEGIFGEVRLGVQAGAFLIKQLTMEFLHTLTN